MATDRSPRMSPAQKAALTRKRRAAARKAALTRKRRSAARKAAITRRSRVKKGSQTITTTIQREWLCEIIAGRKRVEYRQIKPYWEERLSKVEVPFRLRLINGMSKVAPEVTVEIGRVVRNRRKQEFELHIARVIGYKNWDRRREVARV